jgi:hypothetical protein
VVAIAGTSEGELMGEGDGLVLGAAVVGSPVEDTGGTKEGKLLLDSASTLVGLSLGVLEVGAPVGTVLGSLVGELLGDGDGMLERLLLGAAVAGISVNAGTNKKGESLGGGNGALEGFLLGALEVGAPARTVVGTLEEMSLGDGEGTEDEEDCGANEG